MPVERIILIDFHQRTCLSCNYREIRSVDLSIILNTLAERVYAFDVILRSSLKGLAVHANRLYLYVSAEGTVFYIAEGDIFSIMIDLDTTKGSDLKNT